MREKRGSATIKVRRGFGYSPEETEAGWVRWEGLLGFSSSFSKSSDPQEWTCSPGSCRITCTALKRILGNPPLSRGIPLRNQLILDDSTVDKYQNNSANVVSRRVLQHGLGGRYIPWQYHRMRLYQRESNIRASHFLQRRNSLFFCLCFNIYPNANFSVGFSIFLLT